MISFYDIIQAYFVQATGRFVMFSGRDVALLRSWKEQGASAASVCRGIRDAVRQLDRDDPPRSVYNCRKFVQPYVERARSKRAGANDAVASAPSTHGPRAWALASLERAGRACDDGHMRALYREAWNRVNAIGAKDQQPPDIEKTYAALLGLEEWLAKNVFDLLPEATQKQIDTRIDREALIQGVSMSEQAWELHRAARRRQMLSKEHDLVALLP